jgi:ketosteroid isomerase-like protein
MRSSRIVLAALAIITLTGAQKPADPPATATRTKLSEAEATRIAMSPLVHWDTENAKLLDTMYAPDAIGFYGANVRLVANRAGFVAINREFLAMKFDKLSVPLLKVQILSDDIFIITSHTDLTSTDGPVKAMRLRCTDVFQRQSDGKFLVINEHCSFPPKS